MGNYVSHIADFSAYEGKGYSNSCEHLKKILFTELFY